VIGVTKRKGGERKWQVLVEHPEEAAAIREIADRVIAGESLGVLAR
jgi:hypothetical protein